MGTKILLADDSPTIQKVVKITLANESYEIVESATEEKLLPLVMEHLPSVVLLDFNLSESKTGYDLCHLIKLESPNTQVLMMFGTFDTIDDEALRRCGVSAHVVKPFESKMFISLCRQLVERSQSNESTDVNIPLSSEEQSVLENLANEAFSSDEEWTIQGTASIELVSEVEPLVLDEAPSNILESSVSDWGMDVPGVIGQPHAETSELPPVIESENKVVDLLSKQEVKKNSEPIIPKDEDLEYPDFGVKIKGLDDSLELEETSLGYKPKSKLIPLSELQPSTHSSQDISGESTELLDISTLSLDSDDSVKNIEDQIQDEISTDLWAIDEVSHDEIHSQITKVLEQKPRNQDRFDFYEDAQLDNAHTTLSASSLNHGGNDLTVKILAELRPEIERMIQAAVKEFCNQQIDKVAWEVIPDLAENLIRQELKNIADKVSRT